MAQGSSQIIELYKFLIDEKKEYVLSKQVLRSGTSIGANAEEAQAAFSKRDFTHKMSISSKEARETHYWLRLLRDSNYLQENHESLIEDCEELIRILVSIVKNSRS